MTSKQFLTTFKGYKIYVSDKNNEGRPYYSIKKEGGRRTLPLTFESIEEAEKYIDILLSK